MAFYRHLEFPTNFSSYVLNKKESGKSYYRYFLARLSRMFQYSNLPDTIPHEILDRYLMNNGICCITKVNDKLYCFYGNAGGPQDEYYRPTQFIIANPHIKVDGSDFSANVHIFGPSSPSDTCEGVLMRNDSEWQGLYPLIARYSFLMAENILTLRTADVMLRVTALLTAPTDKERIAADEFLKNLEDGKLSTIGENAFFDGIRMQSPPSNNGSYLTQFIEFQQYLKGSFYNEIGLSANYNMKREAIGTGESTMDADSILPLCDDMLQCRREDLARVNSLFGTNITVDYSSSWLANRIQLLSSLSQLRASTAQGVQAGALGGVAGSSGDMGQHGSTSVNTEEHYGTQRVESTEEEQGENVKTGGQGAEENRENQTSEASGESDKENSESRINDLSVDEELTEIYEKSLSQLTENFMNMPEDNNNSTTEEEEKDESDTKKSSED